MIRTIDIRLNAAHPELPLMEASAFVGAPSTAFIRGVPASVGSWRITAVRVAAAWPDNTTETATAVQSADGVWTATLAGMATSGRVKNGLQVLADGVDETGAAVTGYVLGVADIAVYSRDLTIDAGEKTYYLHLFDAAPATPKKGDVATVDGVLKYYDGAAWQSFGGTPQVQADWTESDDTSAAFIKHKPSIPAVDATLSVQGAAADAKATGDALAGKVPITGGAITGPLTVPGAEFNGSYTHFTGVRPAFSAGGANYNLAFTSEIPSVGGLAPLASPAFTGTPTAPTPASGDNSTKVATTAFVQMAVAGATPSDYAQVKAQVQANAAKLEVWLSVNAQTGVVSANYDDGQQA